MAVKKFCESPIFLKSTITKKQVGKTFLIRGAVGQHTNQTRNYALQTQALRRVFDCLLALAITTKHTTDCREKAEKALLLKLTSKLL